MPYRGTSKQIALSNRGKYKAAAKASKTPSTVTPSGHAVRSLPAPARRHSSGLSEGQKIARALKRVRKAYKSGIRAGSSYDPNEAAALIRSVGGSKSEARALSTKVTGESGGNPRAVGHDPGGTTGLGLWQMTTGVGNDDLIARHGGPRAMLKPKPNAKAALELYRGGGIGNWYAPSNAPGNPKKVAPKVKPKAKDLKTLKKAGVKPKEVKKGAPAPRKRPGPWAGSQKAVLSVVPKSFRPEGRGDKRTPAENSSVGGSPTSDHLTSNKLAYAADLPADDGLARAIAKKLGMASHTGTNEVVRDGYRYQLIWQDAGHYDHVHLGAEWVGEGIPPGTIAGGYGGSVASSGGGSPASASTGAPARKPKRKGPTKKQKLAKVRAAYSDTSTDTPDADLDEIERRYGL